MNPPLEHRPAETTVGSHFISNYPPFGAWSPAALPALERALATPPKPAGRSTSLYLHLPFCRQRCIYCYYRVYATGDLVDLRRDFACDCGRRGTFLAGGVRRVAPVPADQEIPAGFDVLFDPDQGGQFNAGYDARANHGIP
jgi:hypothetical protein